MAEFEVEIVWQTYKSYSASFQFSQAVHQMPQRARPAVQFPSKNHIAPSTMAQILVDDELPENLALGSAFTLDFHAATDTVGASGYVKRNLSERPISCSVCPAFQRLQTSRFSIEESPNRIPDLMPTPPLPSRFTSDGVASTYRMH